MCASFFIAKLLQFSNAKDDIYFVDSSVEENGFLIKITKHGTFKIEKEITKPVYKISNFKAQKEITGNNLRIITPYEIINNKSIPIPESDLSKKYPECYKYLLLEKNRLLLRDKGKNSYMPFYVWGRTQGIARFGKKILCPTFSKHPRFLFVSEKESYFTNGYGIFFKNFNHHSNNLLGDSINPLAKEENILEVQKILNSAIMDYYITVTSVSIQGGFPCYQKNFIEKFSIPMFTEQEMEILRNLSEKDEVDEFLINKYQVRIPEPNRLSCTSNNVLTNPS